MRTPRLILVAALAAAWIVNVAAAHAEGTWPAKVALESSRASPGEVVGFTGAGPSDVGSGPCVVEIDGLSDDTATCAWDFEGGITGEFTVPVAAETDSLLVIEVCWPGCYDGTGDEFPPPYWQAYADLAVFARPLVVPDVTCLSVEAATARLAETGLDAAPGGKPDDVVIEQEPLAGHELLPDVPVALIVRNVPVPDVLAMGYDEATAALAERCLAIEVTDDVTAGIVTGQDPGGGAEAAGGTLVEVTMGGPSSEPSPRPTPTPDPIPPEPVSFPLRPVLTAAGLLLLLLAASSLLANRVTRGRRDLTWLGQHVTVAPRPGGPAVSATRAIHDDQHDHVISVVAQEVRRTTNVEEEP